MSDENTNPNISEENFSNLVPLGAGEINNGTSSSPEINSTGSGESSDATTGKKPRKPGSGRPKGSKNKTSLPLGEMAGSTGSPLLEDNLPGFESEIPAVSDFIFDKAEAQKGAAFLVDLMQEVVSEFRLGRLTKKTGDKAFAEFVVNRIGMEPKARDGMELGLVGMCEKHKIDLSKTPEGMFAGGFLLWMLQDNRKIRQAVEEYSKLVVQRS